MIGTASLLLCAWLTADGSYGLLEAFGGRSECSAAFGNSGLTVTVDVKGSLSSVLWPSPTGPSQMAAETDSGNAASSHGIAWGVRTDDKTAWLHEDAWRVEQPSQRDAHGIVTTRLALGELHAKLEQFVASGSDVLVTRLTLESSPSDVQVFWHADLDPTTRAIPELPFLADIATAHRDFAIFVEASEDAVLHFRPDAPSSYDWIDAERIRDDGGPLDKWDAFDEGTWIAYLPVIAGAQFACADRTGANTLLEQIARGQIDGQRSAVGDCAVAAALQPDASGASQWTVIISFAETRKEALESAQAARARGFEALRDETSAFWNARASKWALPQAANEEVHTQCVQALTTLSIAMDRKMKAIARATVDRPPLAMDIVRDGVWSTLALDLAGERELADLHTQFYARAVREKASSGTPIGSIPMGLLADGMDALPHVFLDVEAVGWFLWSVDAHQALLEENPKRVFLDRLWKSTDLSATFLAQWFRDPFVTTPYGFNPGALRDTPSADLAISAYAGLTSALNIADFLDMPRQDWKSRQGQLEDLVRSYTTGDNGTWLTNAPLSLGLTGLIATGDTAWESRIDQALARVDTTPTPEAVKTLCFVALTWRTSPERLARIQPLIGPVFRRVCDEFPADSYYASLAYIAAQIAYGSPTK